MGGRRLQRTGVRRLVQTQHPKLVVEVVQRLAGVPGFQVLPKRWVVEGTFGWLIALPPPRARLRTDHRFRRRLDLSRHAPPHAPQTRMNTSLF